MGMLFVSYPVQVFLDDSGLFGLAVLFQGRKVITLLAVLQGYKYVVFSYNIFPWPTPTFTPHLALTLIKRLFCRL